MTPKRLVTLRRAIPSDFAKLWIWRNDPETRAMFLDTQFISLQDHVAWLNKTLCNSHAALYVAETDGHAVGTLRLDYEPDESQVRVSLTVAPERRRQGYGTAIIAALFTSVHQHEHFLAEIKAGNLASLCVFAANGFTVTSANDQFAVLERVGLQQKRGAA